MDGTEEARKYLENGGLGEVVGLALLCQKAKLPKVQMDTDMALALCELAQESITRRAAH